MEKLHKREKIAKCRTNQQKLRKNQNSESENSGLEIRMPDRPRACVFWNWRAGFFIGVLMLRIRIFENLLTTSTSNSIYICKIGLQIFQFIVTRILPQNLESSRALGGHERKLGRWRTSWNTNKVK